MRAVEQDHLRCAAEMSSRRREQIRIERVALRDRHEVRQAGALQPAPRQRAELRADVDGEQPVRRIHPPEHEAEQER